MPTVKKLSRKLGRAPADAQRLYAHAKSELWPAVNELLRKANELADAVSNIESTVLTENLGAGEELLFSEGNTVKSKTLVAGTGVSIASTDEEVTVAKSTYRWIQETSFDTTSSALRYMALNGEVTASTSIASDQVRICFPRSGRLVSVTLISEDNDLNNTTVGFHLNEGVTAEADVLVNCDLANTPYVFDFSGEAGAAWEVGDLVHISVDPSGAPDNAAVFIEWEIDL